MAFNTDRIVSQTMSKTDLNKNEDLSIFSLLVSCKNMSAEGQTRKTIFDSLYQRLRPFGVRLNYDQSGDVIRRYILSPDKLEMNSYTMKNSYNSIVIDCESWTVKSVGPDIQPTYISKTMRNNCITEYDVYPIVDGTTVTLYHWKDNVFALSTTNGFDVVPIKWLSVLTFGEIFYEIAKSYSGFIDETGLILEYVDGKPVLKSDILDHSTCHSFVLCSKKLHPFQKNVEGLTHIQSVKIHESGITKLPDFKFNSIPKQSIIDVSTMETLLSKRYSSITINDMIRFCKGGLDKFLISPCYGFVFRNKGSGVDILLETDLMIKIRKTVYYPIPKQLLSIILPEHRYLYIGLRAYLHEPSKREFLKIFPEWKSNFDKFNVFIEDTISDMIDVINKKSNKQFAQYMINQIMISNSFIPDNHGIIRDIISNPVYAFAILTGYVSV